MNSILEISDGTTTIDLLSLFRLRSWIPQTPPPKGGGVWSGSPLSQGRQLLIREFDNVIDTFELVAHVKADADALIAQVRKLRQLLVKATDYWVADWATEPVWIKTRGICETNTRYAIIADYRSPNDDDPFEEPVNVFDNFTLVLEHTIWQDTQPDTLQSLPVQCLFPNIDNVEYGQEETTDRNVFINNYASLTNIDHAYYFDANAGAWSGNLAVAALPRNLLPLVPAAGDILYIGAEDAASGNELTFSNVVFDIGQTWGVPAGGALNPHGFVWEYWNGAAWAAMGLHIDNTNENGEMTANPFNTPGVNVLAMNNAYPQSTNLFTLFGGAAPNVNASYIRMRVTAIAGGAPNIAPTQQNRNMYFQQMPWTDIEDKNTGGDIPSLFYTMLTNEAVDLEQDAINFGTRATGIVCGLRSKSRGTFYSHLPLNDDHARFGIMVLANGGAFQNANTSPWHRSIRFTGGATATDTKVCTVTCHPTFNYEGTFNVYLRVNVSTTATLDISWYVKAGFGIPVGGGGAVAKSNIVAQTRRVTSEIMDLGQITIHPSNELDQAYTVFEIWCGDESNQVVDVFDLILIPTDECAWHVYNPDFPLVRMITTGAANQGLITALHVNSVEYQKKGIHAALSSFGDADTWFLAWLSLTWGTLIYPSKIHIANWNSISTGRNVIQNEGDQRLHYFIFDGGQATAAPRIFDVLRARYYYAKRYLSMRGAG